MTLSGSHDMHIGKILKREINPADQARLVEESLRELDGAGV